MNTDRETQIAIALRYTAKTIAGAIAESVDTCLTCIHFDEASEMCAKANARPPARVIAYACPEHAMKAPF